MWNARAKRLVRQTIGLPVVSDGLRWFLQQSSVPAPLRTLAHRKLAKAALFGSRTFRYRTEEGTTLELVHSTATNYLYWLGTYEPETIRVFSALARSATVIFDIGASDALYAILAASVNPAARIHAFEPFTGAADAAARNLELNPAVCRHVELHRMALGAEDGVATLYVASESGGNSSLNQAFRAQHSEQITQVRRGDTFVAEAGLGRVDLLKIDTESTEPDVLRGFASCLERYHPDIVCEVLPGRTEQRLMEILKPLGYQFWAIADGLERRDRIVGDPRPTHANYLFTTADERALAARGLPVAR